MSFCLTFIFLMWKSGLYWSLYILQTTAFGNDIIPVESYIDSIQSAHIGYLSGLIMLHVIWLNSLHSKPKLKHRNCTYTQSLLHRSWIQHWTLSKAYTWLTSEILIRPDQVCWQSSINWLCTMIQTSCFIYAVMIFTCTFVNIISFIYKVIIVWPVL